MLPDDDILVALIQRQSPWVYGYSPTAWTTTDGEELEFVKATVEPMSALTECARRSGNAPDDIFRSDFELGILSYGYILPVGQPFTAERDTPAKRTCERCGREADWREFRAWDTYGNLKFTKRCRQCKATKQRAKRLGEEERREAVAAIVKRYYARTNAWLAEMCKDEGLEAGEKLIRQTRLRLEEANEIPRVPYRFAKDGQGYKVQT